MSFLNKNIAFLNTIDRFKNDYVLVTNKIDDNIKEEIVFLKDTKSFIFRDHEYEIQHNITYSHTLNLVQYGVLEVFDLEEEFNKIDSNLDEPVKVMNKNVRYFDVIHKLDQKAIKDNIISNVERLSTLRIPVVELGMGLRCNNYEELEDYLLIDYGKEHTLLDEQAIVLLKLQEILDNMGIKLDKVTDGDWEFIKYHIPLCFKVTINELEEN